MCIILMSYILVNVLLLLNLSTLIFSLLSTSRKMSRQNFPMVSPRSFLLHLRCWQLKSLYAIPFFSAPQFTRFGPESPEHFSLQSERVLVKRIDAPFHPKVNSQQSSALTTSPLPWSSATNSWASTRQGDRSGIMNHLLKNVRGRISRAWILFPPSVSL